MVGCACVCARVLPSPNPGSVLVVVHELLVVVSS